MDKNIVAPAGENPSPNRRLIPVPKWNDYHDWPTPGGLRHLIFNSRLNGFARAVRRAGGRVLIDEAEFFSWVDAQQNGEKR